MTVRLYKVTGKYEGYVLAYGAADAAKHGGRVRKDCERVYDATAEAALEADSHLARKLPDPSYVYRDELGDRSEWTVAQWAAAAPADAAAEATRLRAEADGYERRAARARTQADELARIAAKAAEPEPSEANREAAYLGALRDAGLPEPDGAP